MIRSCLILGWRTTIVVYWTWRLDRLTRRARKAGIA
mgnify:CR=1 FL=1